MAHPFDRLVIDEQPGELIFTPCPGTQGDSLEAALDTLREAGAALLVTLTPAAELAQLGAGQIGARCAERGLAWFHLPISDEANPQADFDRAWAEARDALLAALAAGQTLAIHCKGGSGRTGLFAARLLIEAGISAPEAIARVQALRPKALCHPAHVAWIGQFH